ncbi:MAG: aldo/keto reductase, partial [Pseudoxanthomonas sp.]
YAGISDTPAWQVARMQTLAELRGWSPLVALQIEYSLAQRTVERELLPMAAELGLSVLAWSPLAMGVLTGKYNRADLERARAQGVGDSPGGEGGRSAVAYSHAMFDERSLAIGEVVKQVAAECGHSPAQVALAWLLQRPGAPIPIVGARTVEQLQDNLGALMVTLDPAQLRALDAASAVELGFPHDFMRSPIPQQLVFGGTRVQAR